MYNTGYIFMYVCIYVYMYRNNDIKSDNKTFFWV